MLVDKIEKNITRLVVFNCYLLKFDVDLKIQYINLCTRTHFKIQYINLHTCTPKYCFGIKNALSILLEQKTKLKQEIINMKIKVIYVRYCFQYKLFAGILGSIRFP